MKDDSQSKRTSFTERIAMMVGMKSREKEEIAPTTEKGKTFETVSAIATEDNRDDDQVELVATFLLATRCRQNLRDIVEPIRVRNEGSPSYDEIRKEKPEGR